MKPSAAVICLAAWSFVGSPNSIDGLLSTQHVEVQVFFFEKQLHEQLIEPREDVPIDEPEIVSLDVVAVVGELDATPLARAAAFASYVPLKNLAAHEVERFELRKHVRG